MPARAIDDWLLIGNSAIPQFIAQGYPDVVSGPADPRHQAHAVEWLAWIAFTIHVAYAQIRHADECR
jgi:glutathione S-transferase